MVLIYGVGAIILIVGGVVELNSQLSYNDPDIQIESEVWLVVDVSAL